MTYELRPFEAERSRAAVVTTFRSIADEFDDGDSVSVALEDQSTRVRLPETFSVELEIERAPIDEEGEAHEIELEIELEWTEPSTERDPSDTASDDRTEVEFGSQGTFQLFEDRANEWRWRLVHRNGNIIATSGEGYTTKQNARKGIRSVRRNAPEAAVVDRSDSPPS
ncbi:hypothetical protein HALLA_13490 [Halostagnicola larsenii XH-48]|uniref:Uncharacterized protein n=1 Tax=Halostagnicola larsenii XH-48 TaxID=797299 RepID=W0JR47_9EURY|nr:HVO_2922 family protein [Halostagnicola larsenii]AHF99644.1 hypothetical protein HALLA_13490 [Halostagnicola larsenii XH-48]